MKIVVICNIGILAFLAGIIVLGSGCIDQNKEQIGYDRDATPMIEGRYISEGAMHPEFTNGKSVQFIGRVSYIPYIMPDRGTLNLIVCGDWKGKKNALYNPRDFCGAEKANDSDGFIAYRDPIIVQIPSEKIIGEISRYSLVGITGYASPEWYILQDIQGRLFPYPIVYAERAEVISESMLINRTGGQ